MRAALAVFAVILAWALPAPARAQGVAPATDLARDAREARARGVPLLLLFSLPDCGYCERARREFLLPLAAGGDWGGKFLLRQVDLGSAAPLTDFAGRATSHAAFARAQRITLTPTVKVFDGAGAEAAEPLVGLTPEYYGLYLERAVEAGLARMAAGGGPD